MTYDLGLALLVVARSLAALAFAASVGGAFAEGAVTEGGIAISLPYYISSIIAAAVAAYTLGRYQMKREHDITDLREQLLRRDTDVDDLRRKLREHSQTCSGHKLNK